MPPIALSDDEMTAILRAAEPIAVERRSAFLHEVAALLQGQDIGGGTVNRVIRETQPRFFDPPDLSRALGTSKYRG